MIVIVLLITLLNTLSTQCLSSAFLEMGSYKKFAHNITNLLKNGQVLVSTHCGEHLYKYAEDLLAGEIWALEMFDSNSKLPPGLLKGRLTDLGSFDECLNVMGKYNSSIDIYGKYCIATIPLNLKFIPESDDLVKTIKDVRIITSNGKKGIQLATCMPNVCTAKEIRQIFSAISLDMNFYEDLCQTADTQPKLDKTAFVAVGFFAVVLAIIVVSTAYDVVLHYLDKSTRSSFLIAFSAFTNGRYLLSLSGNPNQISCLHGIRVISTMWIIIRHRYSIQTSFPTNDYFFKWKWQNTSANMYMINAAIAVDTFFLLAGVLISYNYLGAMKKGVKFNIILHYLHRYLRLTPVIIALIIFYIALLRHVGSGPLWPRYIENDLVIGCETYWWKALLFVQNYGNQTSMCIPHSWYLCVDMQLFLLSPLILIPLKRWPKITLGCTGFLAVCSTVSGSIVSWIYELNIIQSANETQEKVSQYIHYYYFSTPVRAAPWLIGILLGYAIFKLKEKENKVVINKILVIILWTISIGTVCACVLAGHDLILDYDKIACSLHMALVKPAWAIAISWIIFACVSGYGGPINWFLSLPFFEVLSKLTYTLYLVHYALIYIIVARMRETITFGDLEAMYAFWGDFVFTLAACVIIMLAFELPMTTIERLLFRRWEKN